MPSITVEHPSGSLNSAQKSALAEQLTHVLLQIEGGVDNPAARSIAWVRYREVAKDDWFIGGTNDDAFVAKGGKFLAELNVPEGSMDMDRKSQAHRAITDAILDIVGVDKDEKGAARSIWVQIFEWPEGHMATSGNTASMLGIALIAGIDPNNPLLDFPKAYFDAKDRMYDGAQFPARTAGRATVRY